MHTTRSTVLLSALLLSAALPAAAQTRGPPPPARPVAAPAAPASPAAAPSAPQQTTASFMDWTLRCSRLGPPPGAQFCEVAQGIQRDDKPVAQLAIGRPARGQAMQFTILVPVNASFGVAPALSGPAVPGTGEGPALELTWRRCLPGGCTADAPLTEEAIQRMRGWGEAGRITFQDALGRGGAVPFSPRGLAPALDALAKEDGG